MASLLEKITGKSSNNNNNKDTSGTSNSHSSGSSSTASSTSSGPMAVGNTGNTTTTSTTSRTTTQQHNAGNNMGASGVSTHVGSGYSGTGTMTDEAMTRSEEQLRVGKEVVGAGRAALDKYVTTEHVETVVPVTKERVVIEREPVTEANRPQAMSGAQITEAHHEVTLTEERAIAAKEVVPIERIKLGKQVETHEQTVGADLRKEHIDLTTTGINEKFDNVGYGTTTGTKMDPTANNASNTTMNQTSTTTASRKS